MAATMDDTSNTPPADQLATEHGCVDDIGTQMINIDSVQQTIRKQISELERSGIDTSVLELKSLLPNLDSLQMSLRKTFDAQVRPLIQDLHIFNLPVELLNKIFEDVRGDFDSMYDEFPSDGIKDIKSLRLTCRRFCDASSHLLLHRIKISLTTASLEHLDRVSRHPTISKGVRSLRICAALYDPALVRSLRSFIVQVVGKLSGDHRSDLDHMHSHLKKFSLQPWDLTFDPPFHGNLRGLSEVFDDMAKRNETLLSCINYLRAETSPPDVDQIMATLSQVHKQYSQLVNDQNALLRNDTFVTSVAKAVAILPMVSKLSIDDRPGPEFRSLWTELSSPTYKSVRRFLLRPLRWTNTMVSLPEQQHVKLLYQLPLAFLRRGNLLGELRIGVYPDGNHKTRLSEEEARDLVRAAQHLEVLDLDCQTTLQPVQCKYPSGERAIITKLASLFLHGTSLRSVTLRFGFEPEPSLAFLPWANLKRISLVYFYLHYDELSKHIEKLSPGTYILLKEVHLESGLWADLLEVIRAKADCHSDVINPEGCVDAEMTDEFFEIFLSRGHNPSPATAYIRGQISENPLRSPPDQDNMDAEGMGDEN